MNVNILMATYQGEKYLGEQLESIAGQTYSDWMLYVNDDGSTDATMEILEQFAREHEGKVVLMRHESASHGATANFMDLIQKVPQAEWYVLCDQDDVWPKERLERMLQRAQERSTKDRAQEIPRIVYGRAEVVDEQLHPIAESMERCMNMQLVKGKEQTQCLFATYVYGMSMMFNDSLRSLVIGGTAGSQGDILYHDAYLGMVCAYFGEFIKMDDCVTQYRQHGSNESQGVGYFWKDILGRLVHFRGLLHRTIQYKKSMVRQIAAFYQVFGSQMNRGQREELEKVLEILGSKSPCHRLYGGRKNGYFGYPGCGRYVPVLFLF